MKSSLRIKVIAFQITIMLIIIAMIYSVMNDVLMKNIDRLEENDIKKNVDILISLINSDLDDLISQTHDYSEWDATYNYVLDRNEDFIEDNLYHDVLLNLDTNLVAIVDGDGNLIYGSRIDLSTGLELPFPQDLLPSLSKTNVFENSNPEFDLSGIVMLSEGALEVCAAPILTSHFDGNINAHLIFGRYMDKSWFEKISERSKFQLKPVRLDRLEEDRLAYYNTITDASPIKISKLSGNTLEAAILGEDIFNKPVLAYTIKMERNVRAIGLHGLNLMIVSMTLLSLSYLLISIKFLDTHLLKRLLFISKEVDDIGKSRTFSMRLKSEKKNDELGIVANKINYMLDELESSQRTLQAARDNMEKLVEKRTAELVNVNSELTEEKEKIRHLAYHDHLTGMPNGLLLNDYITHAIETANRSAKSPAIMFLDLDGFKMINDTLGHTTGNQVLKAVSERLASTVRKSDIVARIGGDEFCILIENIKGSDSLDMIASKILACFDEPFVLNNQECFLTTSIGIAIYPVDGDTSENLIKNADLAMYRAKEEGRNRYCYCTPEMKDQVIENMKLSNQLWRALEREELEIYYQPQVNNNTKQIVGLEALLRWNHPELGMVPPGKFISLAEQTGSINVIGEWVLEAACRQCKVWQDRYDPLLRIGVNLSVKQFQSHNIAQQIERIVKETQINPQTLELEITESIAARDAVNVIQTLNAIKSLGVQIAIDDFGTDYSSMNYLKQLPIDRIKIAMPFVQGINVNEKDEAIVKAILTLAKSMGMGVIAEGVETESQLVFLTQGSCDETQGYYFYKPMPASQIDTLLSGFVQKG